MITFFFYNGISVFTNQDRTQQTDRRNNLDHSLFSVEKGVLKT